MTSNSRQPKSYTPPKGTPTPSKAQTDQGSRRLSARQVDLQWAAVILLGLVLLGLVLVFGSGTGGEIDHLGVGGHG